MDSVESRRESAHMSGYTPLQYACVMKKADTIMALIGDGVDPNPRNIYGDTALHYAAKAGMIEAVNLLLRANAQVNVQNELGMTALHFACMSQQVGVIKLLTENGADISLRDVKGHTALDLCRTDACRQELRHVSLLPPRPTVPVTVCSRAKPNEFTPLMYACIRGDIEAVNQILSLDSSMINAKSPYGDSALHLAAQSGSPQIVECLLQHGADMNARNELNQLPLDVAVESKQSAVISLLSGSLAVPPSSAVAFTPLQFACASNDLEAVSDILSNPVPPFDVNAVNAYGDTALHYAVRNASQTVVDRLLSAKANVNALNEDGETPLMHAVRRSNRDIVNILVSAGGDLNAVNKKGVSPSDLLKEKGLEVAVDETSSFTPLMYAAVKGDLAQVRTLLGTAGVDMNATNTYGDTALQYACMGNSVEVVELLIGRGADVNSMNKSAETPLHAAVSNRHSDEVVVGIVELLLKAGADTGKVNHSGKSPVEIARSSAVKSLLLK